MSESTIQTSEFTLNNEQLVDMIQEKPSDTETFCGNLRALGLEFQNVDDGYKYNPSKVREFFKI